MISQQERDAIGVALTKAALFYDRTDLTKEKISLMISLLLEEFPEAGAEGILNAISQYRKDPKNLTFPAPAKLAPFLRPVASDEALAIETVNRIILAIDKFGYNSGKQAQEFVGEVGWLIVRDYGGWGLLCQNMGVEYSEQTFRAQARESVKAKLNLSKAKALDKPLELPGGSPLRLEAPVEPIPRETKPDSQAEPVNAHELVQNFLGKLGVQKESSHE